MIGKLVLLIVFFSKHQQAMPSKRIYIFGNISYSIEIERYIFNRKKIISCYALKFRNKKRTAFFFGMKLHKTLVGGNMQKKFIFRLLVSQFWDFYNLLLNSR